MTRATITLTDAFNQKARINIAQLRHIAVWKDSHRVDIWGGANGGRISSLQFTDNTLESGLDKIVAKLGDRGVELLRLEGNGPDKNLDYRFYFRPETIDYFDDDLYKDFGKKALPALVIEDIPFYVSEAEKADFKKALMANSQPGEWIEFSKDLPTQFQCASGHYGFRAAKVVDLFAVPHEKHMAITTTDLRRSFVPMTKPQDKIDAIAGVMSQLVPADAPPSALPLYYDPAFYPENRRHHINIIMKM